MLNYEAIKEDKLYGAVKGEELAEMVRDVASYNGHLSEYEGFDMESLPELMGDNVLDILKRAYHGDFNPHDDYFIINAYGNLDSYSEYDYFEELEGHDVEIIDEFIDLYENKPDFASWASFDLSDYVTDEELEQYEIED